MLVADRLHLVRSRFHGGSMYDIDQLSDLLGLSRNQVRVRLHQFRSLLDAYIVRGQKNKLLIHHNGLTVLQRAVELEKQGLTLEQIQRTLKQELNGHPEGEEGPIESTEEPSYKLVQAYEKLLAKQEEEIAFLRDQIRQKDQQIAYFQQLVENRLPPSREEIEQRLTQRASRWERFKQFLKGE